jgi:energy-coupling factor transporter ATP-binding protein EcfA2
MYLKKAVIDNIKSIEHFEMDFKEPAGWHVIIGDNGSGKSTIVRTIALGLVGPNDAQALSSFEDFSNWLPPKTETGKVLLTVERDNDFDKPKYLMKKEPSATSTITIDRVPGNGKVTISGKIVPENALWGKNAMSGWFAAAYGPFRRLRGGVEVFAHLINSRPRLAACLTAFRDDVALTQLIGWLKDLALDSQKKSDAKSTLNHIIRFINTSKLLPLSAVLLDDIDSDGIKLKDSNGVDVSLYDMSDGFRSVLSMTIDIIRFLLETYGAELVFPNPDQKTIDLPGVVLIDEVDAHLHPTWQTRIGQWFTRYFPNMQFIVTTHSPLVCRACYIGTIWRLAAPGSGNKSGEITGTDKNRLIYGNILDAYGTEVFGNDVSQSEKGNDLLKELADLNKSAFKGKLSEAGMKRMEEIKKIVPTAL